jgi:uncharacterized protein YjbI with pentapeptide repeats
MQSSYFTIDRLQQLHYAFGNIMTTPPPPILKPAALQKELDALREETDARFIHSEHRLIPIITNIVNAYCHKKHIREAMLAFMHYIFSRRMALTIALPLGGIITFLFAVETSEMTSINNALTEGARRSSTNIELTNILDLVNEEAKEFTKKCNKANAKGSIKAFAKEYEAEIKSGKINCDSIILSSPLNARITGLTQALLPYRSLTDTQECDDQQSLQDRGRRWWQYLTGQRNHITCQTLTEPQSPERGQVLLALINTRIPLQYRYKFDKASLEYANLRDKDLISATLDSANLRGADFFIPSLNGAYLSKANLRDAELINATLTGAYLSNANLYNAKLTDSDLSDTNFSRANLTNVNLDRALITCIKNIGCTNFNLATGLTTTQLETACITQSMLETLLSDFPELKNYHLPEACRVIWPKANFNE